MILAVQANGKVLFWVPDVHVLLLLASSWVCGSCHVISYNILMTNLLHIVSLTKTIGAILRIYFMQLIRLNASNESATRKLKTYVERSIRAAYRRVSLIYHLTYIFAY